MSNKDQIMTLISHRKKVYKVKEVDQCKKNQSTFICCAVVNLASFSLHLCMYTTLDPAIVRHFKSLEILSCHHYVNFLLKIRILKHNKKNIKSNLV